MAKSLSKTELLAVEDRKPVPVEVPQWGGTVYLRPCSGNDRDRLESIQVTQENVVGFRARLVAGCLCDEDGTGWELTPAEIMQLGEKSAAALELLVETCMRICGYTKSEVERLEGNSQSGTSDDSGSN